MVKKYLLFFCLLTSAFSYAGDKASNEVAADIMMTSRFSGFCSALFNLSNFQSKTDDKIIEKFVADFMYSELTRVNMTTDEFIDNCKKSNKAYDEYRDVFLNKNLN